MYMVAALFSVCVVVKLVEELRKGCGLFWFIVIPHGCYGCYWLFGAKIAPPGWSILRGDSGEIFVNLKGRLEVNNACLMPL